jgi:signal transduction histidine kinase
MMGDMSTLVSTWARRICALGLTVWAVTTAVGASRPWIAVPAAVLATAGLMLPPKAPIAVLAACLAGMVVLFSVSGFPGPDDPIILALAWACFGAGRHARLVHQPWAAASTLVLLSFNVFGGDNAFPSEVVFPVLFTVVPWSLGLTQHLLELRSQQAYSTAVDSVRLGSTEVTRAVSEERLRLAREIHDIAAHHMTVVSLQVQVLRDRSQLGHPATPDELDEVGRSAQMALADIRRVVGVLRAPGEHATTDPLPGLDDVPELVDECRRAGQRVELHVEGERHEISNGASLTLYRVAQEMLTNARRHGADGTMSLVVRWEPARVVLIGTNPRRRAPLRTPLLDSGSGLVGMCERVELYRGQLTARPDPTGQWVVEASLPVPS